MFHKNKKLEYFRDSSKEGFSISNSVNVRMCEVIGPMFKVQKFKQPVKPNGIYICMLHEKSLSFMQ